MSQEDVERLLGRLLTDDRIRQRGAAQLPDVCRELGFALDSRELGWIRPEDLARLAMASNWLDPHIKRSLRTGKQYRRKGENRA